MTIAPRLSEFVSDLETVLAETTDEPQILARGKVLLERLTARDDWLPEAYARPNPERYQQYLLHRDPEGRFSVVSFVWAPGQTTPVHNHTVWGLVGVLRGGEVSQGFARGADGLMLGGPTHELGPGDVEAVSPSIGDIHQVSNAYTDRVSVSIHVYGADIGAVERATFDAAGNAKPFVSGYTKIDQ